MQVRGGQVSLTADLGRQSRPNHGKHFLRQHGEHESISPLVFVLRVSIKLFAVEAILAI